MANNKLQTSLEDFGNIVKQDGIDADGVMLALFDHALVSQVALNPKASTRGIRGHWAVKVQYRDKARSMPIAKHYEFVTSKLKGFSDDRSGAEVLDSLIAQKALVRTRSNWIGLPGAFSNGSQPVADTTTADDVL